MSQVYRLLLMFGLLLWTAPSFGQTSCLPDYTALQTIETVNLAAPSSFVRPLVSRGGGGDFTTLVRLEGQVLPFNGGSLRLKVQFDPDFNGVSLPYNLLAVLVVSEGATLAWYDFTDGCRGIGIGFFPGRVIELPAIKLVGGKSQKLQIMVWGRL